MAMPLFWIVHEVDGEPFVWIQDAPALVYARLAASIAGFPGNAANFREAHALTSRMGKKVPRAMRRRVLKPGEAKRLLEKLG